MKKQLICLDHAWSSIPNPIQEWIHLGPFIIRLSFSSPLLKEFLFPAFSHLRTDKQKEDLTVCIWDTKEAQVSLPPLDWPLIHLQGYRGGYRAPIYFHYFETLQALSFLDVEDQRAHYIVRDQTLLPWWVRGSPLQVIFHAWLREKKMQLTHAAAVAEGEKGVLFLGKGGSGKSTTTLQCVKHGFYLIGEDYCILDPATDKVYTIYQTAKLCPDAKHHFSHLEDKIQNRGAGLEEKMLLFYRDLFPHQIQKQTKAKILISLEVGHYKTPSFQEKTGQEGMKPLMMSSLSQLPFHQKPTIDLFKQFIQNKRIFHMTLGTDLEKNVHMVRELLR